MVKYLADTNVFIRFFIKDDIFQYKEVEKYFLLAQKGTIKIFVLSEVILEVEYVLRKVYKTSKSEISKNLSSLLKMSYLYVDKADLLISALKYYIKNNIDLVDALVYVESRERNLEILSFDKDFKKIKK